MSEGKFYTFVKDGSCHWYMIPVDMKEEFYDLEKKCDRLSRKVDYTDDSESMKKKIENLKK